MRINPDLPQKLQRRFPRRTRRGLSLTEAALSLIILAMAAEGAADLWARELIRKAAREEYRLLDEVAEVTATYLERDLVTLTRAYIPAPRKLEGRDLVQVGLWPASKSFVTQRKRPIEIWYAKGPWDTIEIYVLASDPVDPPSLPEPDTAVEAIGWISPLSPQFITGPGTSMAVPTMTAATRAAFRPGAAVAMRHLSLRRDTMPYLYRVAVPGRPELNRMETNLLMGGNDILGADRIAVRLINTGTGNIGDVRSENITAYNALRAETLRITGTAYVNQINVADELTANTVSAGSVIATTLQAATASISSVQVTDHIVTGSLTATGAVTAGRIDTPRLTVDQLTAGTATVGQVGATTLSATTATVRSLTVQTCSGCR